MPPLLFTTPTGEIFELTPDELPSGIVRSTTTIAAMDGEKSSETPPQETQMPLLPKHEGPSSASASLDGTGESTTTTALQSSITQRSHSQSCVGSTPLIEILSEKELLCKNTPDTPQTPESLSIHGTRDRSRSLSIVKVAMEYNEYGELVEESKLRHHPTPDELIVTQLLRTIRKRFHHELREKITKIVNPPRDDKGSVLLEDEGITRRLTWYFDFKSISPSLDTEGSPDTVPIQRSPPRVLEIGCSDGSWCMRFKDEQPNWIVQGVDDTDHWSCVDKDLIVRDFMNAENPANPEDYFNRATHQGPEFTIRNINSLLTHKNPMLHNLYDFIRAREIFDRVESYKTFLEDIRLMLKPGGAVEFFEIDPRPRCASIQCSIDEVEKITRQKSGPGIDWTDNIRDRFRDPYDAELAKDVPGWSTRVEERLKAILRPKDGVAAANLMSWLQGAGFSEVKQTVLPLRVGDDSLQGQHLKDFLLYQISLENDIPKLLEELPVVEMNALQSGSYFLNLHVVKGLKPMYPRPGDLLKDGERLDMTPSKYDAMAHSMARNETRAPYKRFDLEGKLSNMMKTLTTLHGAPDSRTVTRGANDEGLFPILARKSDSESLFNAPPFVTVQQLSDHNSDSGIGGEK